MKVPTTVENLPVNVEERKILSNTFTRRYKLFYQ